MTDGQGELGDDQRDQEAGQVAKVQGRFARRVGGVGRRAVDLADEQHRQHALDDRHDDPDHGGTVDARNRKLRNHAQAERDQHHLAHGRGDPDQVGATPMRQLRQVEHAQQVEERDGQRDAHHGHHLGQQALGRPHREAEEGLADTGQRKERADPVMTAMYSSM